MARAKRGALTVCLRTAGAVNSCSAPLAPHPPIPLPPITSLPLDSASLAATPAQDDAAALRMDCAWADGRCAFGYGLAPLSADTTRASAVDLRCARCRGALHLLHRAGSQHALCDGWHLRLQRRVPSGNLHLVCSLQGPSPPSNVRTFRASAFALAPAYIPPCNALTHPTDDA